MSTIPNGITGPVTAKYNLLVHPETAQTITDIKHEASHDINRMAQMIKDLRELCIDQHKMVDDAKRTAAENLALALRNSEFATNQQEQLTDLEQQRKAQSVVIENQEEEISHLHDDRRALETKLNAQLQACTDIALQLSIARRDHASAEHAHRQTVEAFAAERAEVQKALRDLDKIRSLGAQYKKECFKLLEDNNQLTERLNARVIWRKVTNYFPAFPFHRDRVEEI